MSTGWEVIAQRRFGGHGGVSTEWEITTRIPDLNSWLSNFFAGLLPSYPSVEEGSIFSDRECRGFHLRQGVTPSTFGRVVAAVVTRNHRTLRSALLQANKDLARHEASMAVRAAKIKAGGCPMDGNRVYYSSEARGATLVNVLMCRACYRASQKFQMGISP